MGDTIRFKKGPKSDLPILGIGEPGFTTNEDDQRLYIGGIEGNIPIATVSDINNLVTTKDIVILVRKDGSDDNRLSADTPFLTIQKAINSLPKTINHNVNIIIGNGVYDENVKIIGFKGGGKLDLRPENATSTTVEVSVTNFLISNNSLEIALNTITITEPSKTKIGITVTNSTKILLNYINDIVAVSRVGVRSDYANVKVANSTISNKETALYSIDCSNIVSFCNSGTNNKTALMASSGNIKKASTQPTGTTAETTYNGGDIR